MHQVLKMLAGGDRRSIGRSNEVVAHVLQEPRLIDVLFSGMLVDNPLIRMRCVDAAEKVTAVHPEYLAPFKKILLGTLAKIEQPEVRWHVAPMLARLPLSETEQGAVVGILTSYLNDRSSIVKTFAMQALGDLAMRNETLLPLARRQIEELVAVGTPAMKARGRKLLAEFDRLAARTISDAPRRGYAPSQYARSLKLEFRHDWRFRVRRSGAS